MLKKIQAPVRRAGLILGAAAGGLLAAAFLSAATASAEPGHLDPLPPSLQPGGGGPGIPPPPTPPPPPGSVNIFGFAPVGPADVIETSNTGLLSQEVQQTQNFVIPGPDDSPILGSFVGDETLSSGPLLSSTEIVVAQDPIGAAPPIASEFKQTDILGLIDNLYANVPSGPNAGTADLLITPLGNLQLTPDSMDSVDPFFLA